MVESLLEEVRDHIAESSKHIDQAKAVVNDACDDFIRKSKRAVKAGRGAAEDLVGHAEHTVKRHPKSAVATGVMTGIIVGFCLGWVLASRE
jgi:ElaB/YqjD/DUF883 family membrane-anchored ribosome-binding protein